MAKTGLLMTMGVFAVGAGALVAAALVPVFSPYRDKPDRPVQARLVPEPDAEDELAGPRDYDHTADWRRRDPADGKGLRMEYRDGAVTVEVPGWVEDGGAWLALGRRVWRDWVEPGEDASGNSWWGRERDDDDLDGYRPDEDSAQPRYALRRGHGWDQGEQGYHKVPRSYGDRDDDDSHISDWHDRSDAGSDYDQTDYGETDYAGPRRFVPYAPPPQAMTEAPLDAFADERPSPARSASPARRTVPSSPAASSDAAANAAQRAQAAARDVRAAEQAVD